MIAYFSATGNSGFVARSLANLLGEEAFSITSDSIAFKPSGNLNRFIMVFPIYSWGVPPIVMEWIANITEADAELMRQQRARIIMIATCGDEVAMAPQQFKAAWEEKGLEVCAAWSVIMPNNYVLLPGFDVDSPDVERRKLDKAPERIREIASKIIAGEMDFDVTVGSNPRLKSRLVYPLFKRWGVNPKRWRASEECIRCERCVAACPINNVKMKSGLPFWGDNCISCLACYHHCPTHAVEYASATKRKGQYFCHLKPIKK